MAEVKSQTLSFLFADFILRIRRVICDISKLGVSCLLAQSLGMRSSLLACHVGLVQGGNRFGLLLSSSLARREDDATYVCQSLHLQ